MNGMCYIRGQAQDYDHWRQLGNDGWSWDDVLPYFLKSENNELGADALHNVGGPLNVAQVEERDRHEISDALIAALVSLGGEL